MGYGEYYLDKLFSKKLLAIAGTLYSENYMIFGSVSYAGFIYEDSNGIKLVLREKLVVNPTGFYYYDTYIDLSTLLECLQDAASIIQKNYFINQIPDIYINTGIRDKIYAGKTIKDYGILSVNKKQEIMSAILVKRKGELVFYFKFFNFLFIEYIPISLQGLNKLIRAIKEAQELKQKPDESQLDNITAKCKS